jgi:HAMP domain-containing protein
MVLAMSAPLREGSGRRIGTVSVLIDLQSLHEDWARLSLPLQSRLSLVDHDGTILVTRPDFEKFVGKDASVTIKNALASNPDGVGIALGVDGVERAFALKPIPRARWRASAAIPADAVFAASRAQLYNSAAVSLVVMAAVLSLGLVMARRMAAPLNSLSQVAKAVGRGDLQVRASELVPGEFNILAAEFNAMLDARQAAVAALTESERRFADLLANVDMVSLMVNHEGAITYCNDYLLSPDGVGEGRTPREELDRCVGATRPPCRIGSVRAGDAWRPLAPP